MIAAMGTIGHPTSAEISPSLAAVVAAVDLDDCGYRSQTSPDGMMTVVFTDIESSTEMMERLGEGRWLEVLRTHNSLLRRVVSRGDGMIVKSQGDGFMLVFSSASAALSCSVDLQRTFAAYNAKNPQQPLRVRIGLHTGNVFQEGDDFLGKSVVLAARITGRARGGEVLASAACRDYTEHLGCWRFGPPTELSLKGLATAQRVHSVDWAAR